MSNHNTVEITGNIIVHHPIKVEAEVIPFTTAHEFDEWDWYHAIRSAA